MIRKLYIEWGRGRERTDRAAEKLAPLLAMRVPLRKELESFAPFGDDYLALASTLAHLNMLAQHFGLPPDRPPWQAPQVGRDFANP